VWHLSLPLINSLNKSEAAFSHAGYASWGISLSSVLLHRHLHESHTYNAYLKYCDGNCCIGQVKTAVSFLIETVSILLNIK